ncbi:DUF3301 domain-containing protein [Agaribacterium sp. ZY112]|uniref:DUF3301 domain-containing protein n=1 Tax=Agaribacterium sp. ZY112 TaxID=3233574 RepID=UPI00352345FC
MTIHDLIIIFIIAMLAYLVWLHLEVSNLARAAATKRCKESDLVLLDQSVILNSISLKKSKFSLFAVERKYHFEFSSIGDTRYRGEVVFLGRRLQFVGLQPYKLQ